MDYKKAYNEALEKARQLCTYPTSKPFISDLQNLFPELAESDDGETKKSLMQYIWNIYHREYCPPTPSIETCDKWLAWLEKQEVQKEDVHSKEFWGEIRKNLSDFLQEFCERGINTNFDRWTESDRVNWLLWLEKQGESYTKRDIDNAYIEGMAFAKHELEKQGEQKFVDKVESKFKVGDWIVNKGHSYLIADIDYSEQRYLFEIGGYTHEQLNWEYIELADKRYHLWTIQDAKDGDILATMSGAFIYNGNRGGSGFPGSYCGINTLGRFQTGAETHWTEKKVYPATKEQRDTLERAMTNAGYRWNKEELKLEKI